MVVISRLYGGDVTISGSLLDTQMRDSVWFMIALTIVKFNDFLYNRPYISHTNSCNLQLNK